MKAIVVKKSFGFQTAGTILNLGELPNNHLANEGFIVAIDIPEGFDLSVIKCEPIIIPQKWVKEGHPDLSSRPMMSVVVGHDGNNQPVTEIVPDTSYEYIPEDSSFVIVEDTEKKSASVQNKKVDKYVKRIDYSKQIIGTMAFLNEGKNLSIDQIISMNTTYGPIKGLLETGSYGSAYQMVRAITPSDAITASDINVISGMISTFMSNEG